MKNNAKLHQQQPMVQLTVEQHTGLSSSVSKHTVKQTLLDIGLPSKASFMSGYERKNVPPHVHLLQKYIKSTNRQEIILS